MADMRIVAISDLHGLLLEIPPCDLLVIAGDVCPDRPYGELAAYAPTHQQRWFDQKFRPWLAGTPATHRVLTWGNHDWCGQACDFTTDGPTAAPTTRLQILVDAGTSVPYPSPSNGRLAIWGTPWSNRFLHWAFMKPPRDLARVYEAIPSDVDVLVIHQPPFGYGDWLSRVSSRAEHLGSRELLAAIDRVKPRLVICGHIHEGQGRYRYDDTWIYNVSLVDERYRHVHAPTVIDLPEFSSAPVADSAAPLHSGL